MKRLVNNLFLMTLFFVLSNFVFAQEKTSTVETKGNLQHLKAWDGKYPGGETENAKGFYDLSEIKEPLLKLLNKRDFNRLIGKSEWTGEHAIKVRGNFLLVDNCKYHCCECRTNLLVVNLNNSSMYIFFIDQNSDGSREKVRFISSEGKNTALPKELCKYVEDGVPNLGCDK